MGVVYNVLSTYVVVELRCPAHACHMGVSASLANHIPHIT